MSNEVNLVDLTEVVTESSSGKYLLAVIKLVTLKGIIAINAIDRADIATYIPALMSNSTWAYAVKENVTLTKTNVCGNF